MQKQSVQELQQRFVEDIYSIARGYIDALGLPLSDRFVHLDDPLIRWLDFKLRYIEPKPRRVVCSNRFAISNLASGAADALQRIQNMFEAGEDVNPYQGKGMSLYHDTGAGNRAKRTDLLWADWGMWHLHLDNSEIPVGERYAPRSDWLLFCYVFDDGVAFVDVRRHDDPGVFENGGIIETAIRNWPALFEHHRLNGSGPLESGSTSPRPEAETRQLRQGGVQGFLTVDGNVYIPPGGGITSASTATRVSRLRSDLLGYVKALAALVSDPNGQWIDTHHTVPNETFGLTLTPEGLAVYEEKSDKARLLPRREAGSNNWLSVLHDQMCPKWMLEELARRIAPES